jgi:hypothetical protein
MDSHILSFLPVVNLPSYNTAGIGFQSSNLDRNLFLLSSTLRSQPYASATGTGRDRDPMGLDRGRVARASSSGRRARRGRAGTSLRSRRHLPGNEQIYLSSVVLIVGKAFVNLRSGEWREAVFPLRVDCFAILKQADDVVDGNPGTFHYRVPTPHARSNHADIPPIRKMGHVFKGHFCPQ